MAKKTTLQDEALIKVELIPEVAAKYEFRFPVESNEIQIAGVPGGVIDLSTITLDQVKNLGGLPAVLKERSPENP